MKTMIKIKLACLLLISFTACNFLDKQPHELTPETYFNNESELQLFLTGVYSPLGQENFYGNYYPLYNSGGDDLSFFQRANPTQSIICGNANNSNEFVTAFWRVLYDGINRANILIENVDRNTEITESFRNQVKAEALFLRGFYYFNLVQAFGDVPFRIQAVQSVNNLALPRTDKQEIYEQIIQDIITSIPNLRSASNTNPGYVTQSAAKGILARIYLFRAGEHFRDKKPAGSEVQNYFVQARKWALEVRDSQIHGLVSDYSQVFIDMAQDKYNSTGVKESIWEAELAGNRISQPDWAAGRIGNVIGFGSTVDHSAIAAVKDLTGIKNPGYSYRFVYASTKLYDMYRTEGDSVRSQWNIAPYEYKFATGGNRELIGIEYFYGKKPIGLTQIDGVPVTELAQTASRTEVRSAAKYRRELEQVIPKNKNYTPINFPILRYSDILLMIAETENEINNAPTQLAYDALNEVRRRAKLQEYGSANGLTKDSFRDVIKNERAMELCFEAIRRWDLVRWGDFHSTMQAMRSVVATNENWIATFKYASNYYNVSEHYNYFPIPSLEMSVNNQITSNNPGW